MSVLCDWFKYYHLQSNCFASNFATIESFKIGIFFWPGLN